VRKFKLQVQTSVDGYMAGPNGEMDWMTFPWTDDNLQAHSDVTFGGISMRGLQWLATKPSATGSGRSPTESSSPYAAYRREAVKVNRTIPIVQPAARESDATRASFRHAGEGLEPPTRGL
jgi:hypothetical protein